MADGVSITPGSGELISTEEITNLNGGAVSTQQVQRIGVTFVTGNGAARDADLGAGNTGSATQRVVIASNQVPIPASQSGTWNITNISGTISLPTGAATAANQTTIIGHVDGIETALTAVNASLDAIEAAATGALADTATVANVTVGTTSTQILAASTSRKADTFIVNNSDVDVWINTGTAVVGTGHRLRPGGSYEVRHELVVNGIVATGTANVSRESYA